MNAKGCGIGAATILGAPYFLLKLPPLAQGAAVQIPNFDPVLVHLGPLAIRWYALAYIAGILLGWRYAVTLVKNPRLWRGTTPTATPLQIDDLILWVTLGIILGGRLGSVLFYSPQVIWTDPVAILRIWDGGMSFHGGVIGVSVALILFSRRYKLSLLGLADLAAACEPIGQFFGRCANFINGELWGRPTNGPWGMIFCNDHIRAVHGACPVGARHPSQLYEAALEGVVLFLILRAATHLGKWLPRRGAVTGLFLFFYGAFRILLENVREPDVGMPDFPFGLTMGMILSWPMVFVGVFLIWWALRKPAPAETAG
jgi:phosphatidylglycerol:prolipoprotein diacylglycerol transferase